MTLHSLTRILKTSKLNIILPRCNYHSNKGLKSHYIHIYIHTYTHVYIYTCVHMYTYHTHSLTRILKTSKLNIYFFFKIKIIILDYQYQGTSTIPTKDKNHTTSSTTAISFAIPSTTVFIESTIYF